MIHKPFSEWTLEEKLREFSDDLLARLDFEEPGENKEHIFMSQYIRAMSKQFAGYADDAAALYSEKQAAKKAWQRVMVDNAKLRRILTVEYGHDNTKMTGESNA